VCSKIHYSEFFSAQTHLQLPLRRTFNLTIKKILNTKLDGVRRVRRPKMRWEDGVDQDTRILEVKNWKKVALDREEWAKLLNTLRRGDAGLRF